MDKRPVEELTFEEAQAELEQMVEALEDRHTGLEDALAIWERGEALHAWCRQRLDYAAARLEKLTLSSDEIAAATASDSAGDDFAPEGRVPESALDDPAPASTPNDLESAPMSAPSELDILEDDQTIF